MDHTIFDLEQELLDYNQEFLENSNLDYITYSLPNIEINYPPNNSSTSNIFTIDRGIIQPSFPKSYEEQNILIATEILNNKGLYVYQLCEINAHSNLIDKWIISDETSDNITPKNSPTNIQTKLEPDTEDNPSRLNSSTISTPSNKQETQKNQKYEIRKPTDDERRFYRKLEFIKNNILLQTTTKRVEKIKKLKELKRLCRGNEYRLIKDKIVHKKLKRPTINYDIINKYKLEFEETTGAKFMIYSDIMSDPEAVQFLMDYIFKSE